MKRLGDTPEFQRIRDDHCRFCGRPRSDWHHIVYRSLGGTDDPRNLCPLCRICHGDVHDKKVDVLSVLSLEEQAYAASLIGIERAHRLLAPSLWREKALRGEVERFRPDLESLA